jgi:hypothetical protein
MSHGFTRLVIDLVLLCSTAAGNPDAAAWKR